MSFKLRGICVRRPLSIRVGEGNKRGPCHGVQNQFAGVMELAPVPLAPLFVRRRQKGLNLRIRPTRAVVMNMSNCLLNLCLVPHMRLWKLIVHLCYGVPMKRDEAISRLRQHEAHLKRLGVEHLYMFGSTARDEAKEDSDVDLFFDYEKGKLGLYELMDVKAYAATILGRKTDIMTRDSLHKTMRRQIEETAVRVF